MRELSVRDNPCILSMSSEVDGKVSKLSDKARQNDTWVRVTNKWMNFEAHLIQASTRHAYHTCGFSQKTL